MSTIVGTRRISSSSQMMSARPNARLPAWKRASRKLPLRASYGRLDAHDGDVGVLRRLGDADGAGQHGALEPLDVDAGVAPKWQHVVVVLQQDEGACLRPVAAVHELRSPDDLGCLPAPRRTGRRTGRAGTCPAAADGRTRRCAPRRSDPSERARPRPRGRPRRRTGRHPRSSAFSARSSVLRCSTPQARAGQTTPSITASVSSPQSEHTTPSNPYRSRSSPVITPWLNPKPTSSCSVPTGMP